MIKTVTLWYEAYKDSYGQVKLEQRISNYGTPKLQRVNAKIIKIEIDLDDEIFTPGPIPVKIDMVESTQELAKAQNNIEISIRHNLVDDIVDEM